MVPVAFSPEELLTRPGAQQIIEELRRKAAAHKP
jgi:hypothetical protein